MRANVMVLLQGYTDKYNRIAQIHPEQIPTDSHISKCFGGQYGGFVTADST